MRPLDGLVVLDLTRLLPGGAATLWLANFGAEVIKIEEPETGDYGRRMPPLVDGEGAVFQAVNRGKKSIALDLKSDGGRAALLALARRADVLVEGFRPGVMRRLGLDYETLRAQNERLIYASLTGYGQSGPYAQMAGHDVNYIALGGLLELTGAIPGAQIADLAGGAMQTVIGVLLALEARHRTGRGQHVDVSMLDGVLALLALPLAHWNATGESPAALSGHYGCYRAYECGDGRRIAVGALEPKFWSALCRRLDRADLESGQFAGDPRRSGIIAELERIFRTRPAREWVEHFAGVDACVTAALDLAEVAADEHLRRRGTLVESDGRVSIGPLPVLSETPGRIGGPPPRLGQHTMEGE